MTISHGNKIDGAIHRIHEHSEINPRRVKSERNAPRKLRTKRDIIYICCVKNGTKEDKRPPHFVKIVKINFYGRRIMNTTSIY